jgi:hypothetical protein
MEVDCNGLHSTGGPTPRNGLVAYLAAFAWHTIPATRRQAVLVRTDIQTDRQADRQTDRQIDGQTGRQTDR